MSDFQTVHFSFCDFNDPLHQKKLVELLQHYIADPMGGSTPLIEVEQKALISGLASNSSAFVLFILLGDRFIGLSTCFVNFSTFKVKPYINIHDVVILKEYRGKGFGRKLLEKIIDIARERNYCKITLEVREDNANARKLYSDLGFDDSDPVMYFWTKYI